MKRAQDPGEINLAHKPEREYRVYPALIERCSRLEPVGTAVAHPCDQASLTAAVEAAEADLIRPILVGPEARIRGVAEQLGLDTSGRMLLGTDIASAMTTLEALRVDVIGLNCSTGPEHMRDPIRWLAEHARRPVSCIPNAGLPLNTGTGDAVYPLEPEPMAAALARKLAGLISIEVEDYDNRVLVAGRAGLSAKRLRAALGADPILAATLPRLKLRTLSAAGKHGAVRVR